MSVMRPASVDQDSRFGNKAKKLQATMKFAPELSQKVKRAGAHSLQKFWA